MIFRLLVIFLLFILPVRASSQESENGMYACLQQKYQQAGFDWANTCDSIIYLLTGKTDSLTKAEILSVSNDTGSYTRLSHGLKSKIKAIRSTDYSIAENCLSYFTHRDGHELKTEGAAAAFLELFKRKAPHEEYMLFYANLDDDLFMHPFYRYTFITWMLNYSE